MDIPQNRATGPPGNVLVECSLLVDSSYPSRSIGIICCNAATSGEGSVTAMASLIVEHNAACERAQLSTCHCFCHGAGHQLDLLKRAVSCSTTGKNNVAQLLADLDSVYGGFHSGYRDGATPSRRPVPHDIATIGLLRGRGATWVESLLVDEAMHTAFVSTAHYSASLTASEREARSDFVEHLANGAFRIVGADVDAHNISDPHLWCSILAEALDPSGAQYRHLSGASPHGRICYPRSGQVRVPKRFAAARMAGLTHVEKSLVDYKAVMGAPDILNLMGAAACPDLWHHPAAVRYALLPFVAKPGWPSALTTTLAKRPEFDVLETRWTQRGNW
jgi:hypothetical protein